VKPPRYPLQAVLQQREAAKDEAKRALAEAIRALDREEALLREKEAAREALRADREERSRHVYDPDERGMLSIPTIEKRTQGIRYLEGKIEEAGRAIAAQKEAVARAEGEVEARRAALVEADKALKAVEKHHESWLADWQKEMGRKEQRQSEEVVIARYVADGTSRADEP
jgi:flagellar export protein FliJ